MTATADPASLPPTPAGRRSVTVRAVFELLASMRFAIALLTVICIASVIGTVIEQRQPAINYVNQFGPFWSQVFGQLDLYTVYGAWWFLLILAFLVLSTSLCIARNTPKILADLRTFKEGVREQSLLAFHHKAEAMLDEAPDAARRRIEAGLREQGWAVKADERSGAVAGTSGASHGASSGMSAGVMLAARRGGANKVGYLLAHSAIVLICLGGLADGDLLVRAQMALDGLEPYVPGRAGADPASPKHRLSVRNPGFRGNLSVPEGQRNGSAVLNLSDGLMLQPLPFEVELKRFRVEYYATGMPKLFASDIVVHDGAQAIPATVEVNKPFIHRGVAIYQSNFEDGGSQLKLRPWQLGRAPLQPGTAAIGGTVGSTQSLPAALTGGAPLALELTDLRVINVENLAADAAAAGASAVDVRKVDLGGQLESRLGAADKSRNRKLLRNVGPSVAYKLRDAAGQAREYRNYMLPIDLDGQRVFLLGQRDSPAEAFRYLRVPADENGELTGWMRLRAALADPQARATAAQRYLDHALAGQRPDLIDAMQQTARRALDLFAGAAPPRAAAGAAPAAPTGGLQALSDDIEAAVPEAQRAGAAEALIRVLNGSLYELWVLSREQAGLAARPLDESTQAFMAQSVLALSDSFFYGAPVILTLDDFRQVQASVFQVTRAPGQKVVYLGCLLLVLGVFAMLYIREARVWVWLQPGASGGTRARMALSATRQTLDLDRDFDALRQRLLSPPAPSVEPT